MDVKLIAAVASGEADDAIVLGAAANLAKRFSARVKVIPAFADLAADRVYFGAALHSLPAEVLARLAAGERAQQESIEQAAAAAAAREGLEGGATTMSVSRRDLRPAAAVAREAVLADLVLIGGAAVRGPGLSGLFAETLIYSRAPVLLVRGEPLAFGHAAVAWDGSAQAGRAIRAALPLLARMKGVFVLTNAEEVGARGAGPLEDLRAYLALHGVAKVATRDVKGRDVAQSLLAAAREDACELLVAGGYGRPRLYELVLGGATRGFVNAEGLPHILLVH